LSANLRRVVVCLDVDGTRVKKGVRFESLRDVGDPVELAAFYEAEGADEIVFLDITASVEDRPTFLATVRATAEALFIPLTLGGGIRTIDDVEAGLRAGADKIAINSAALRRPELLTEAASRFGAQCVVLSIDAKRDESMPCGYRVVTHGGRTPSERDVLEWAREGTERGAGEILLTSIDRDGARSGYDVRLTRAVADAVSTPVVASGGAGEASHLVDVIQAGGADAALVAGILHDRVTTVQELKRSMAVRGVPVRVSGGSGS
jgi:imidazole glycerol-phosphate synthase subunit HisF